MIQTRTNANQEVRVRMYDDSYQIAAETVNSLEEAIARVATTPSNRKPSFWASIHTAGTKPQTEVEYRFKRVGKELALYKIYNWDFEAMRQPGSGVSGPKALDCELPISQVEIALNHGHI